jgi:L-ornithine N5-oxygenase
VNEIFDPDRVDGFFGTSDGKRGAMVKEDRATNYGVVREELLARLYERLYTQRLDVPNEKERKVAILSNTCVSGTRGIKAGGRDKIVLELQTARDVADTASIKRSELVVDAVFVATGYIRNVHEDILAKTKDLVSASAREQGGALFPVGRDYKVAFDAAKVDEGAGVWLQGCNERTHGVSSFLLFPKHLLYPAPSWNLHSTSMPLFISKPQEGSWDKSPY